MKELEQEFLYKKRLMGHLFGRRWSRPPRFVGGHLPDLRSAADHGGPSNLYLSTAPCEDLKRLVTRDEVMRGAPGSRGTEAVRRRTSPRRALRLPENARAPAEPGLLGSRERQHVPGRGPPGPGHRHREEDPPRALEPGAVNLFSNSVRLTFKGKPITPQEIRTHLRRSSSR